MNRMPCHWKWRNTTITENRCNESWRFIELFNMSKWEWMDFGIGYERGKNEQIKTKWEKQKQKKIIQTYSLRYRVLRRLTVVAKITFLVLMFSCSFFFLFRFMDECDTIAYSILVQVVLPNDGYRPLRMLSYTKKKWKERKRNE